MAIAPKLADGESFVAGRSIALAKELIEAAEAAGISPARIVTASHGYIVPSELLADEEEEAEEEESADEFDPSKANVEEVKDYLANADDAERERVLAAEANGKKRSGVLAFTSEESK